MTPIIRLSAINKFYGPKTVLRDVDLDIAPGELYGLLGPNGSGKSTLLRIIAGALRADQGHVAAPDSIGYVSQRFGHYDDLTVEENIAFSGRCYGLSGRELHRQVDEVLERLGLEQSRREPAGHLSHGWRQRLALAAALCHKPSVLLLDEATAGIDPVARRDLWTLLAGCARSGTAVVLATHHLDEAEQCDRIGYLSRGELVFSASPTEIRGGATLGDGIASAVRRNQAA